MSRIESGRTFTVRSYDRGLQWFSDNWPERAVWPPEVFRPTPQTSEGQAA